MPNLTRSPEFLSKFLKFKEKYLVNKDEKSWLSVSAVKLLAMSGYIEGGLGAGI